MASNVLRRVTMTAGLLAAVAALSACSSDTSVDVSAADVVGSWGTSTIVGQAYLNLEPDGTVVGSDGCNRLTSTWEAGGKGVSFSAWAGTTAACPQLDGWLSSAVGGRLEGGDLLLFDQNNLNVGTLQSTH